MLDQTESAISSHHHDKMAAIKLATMPHFLVDRDFMSKGLHGVPYPNGPAPPMFGSTPLSPMPLRIPHIGPPIGCSIGMRPPQQGLPHIPNNRGVMRPDVRAPHTAAPSLASFLTGHYVAATATAATALQNNMQYFSHLLSPGVAASYGRKMFRCTQCRYLTDRKNNLKRHVLTMHQKCTRMLECCGLAFPTKASLREHAMIFHCDGYTCAYCGRRFCRKALLKRHLSVHNGQKDFLCGVCDYATSHKSNLERHRKVHSREGDMDDLDSYYPEDEGDKLNLFSKFDGLSSRVLSENGDLECSSSTLEDDSDIEVDVVSSDDELSAECDSPVFASSLSVPSEKEAQPSASDTINTPLHSVPSALNTINTPLHSVPSASDTIHIPLHSVRSASDTINISLHSVPPVTNSGSHIVNTSAEQDICMQQQTLNNHQNKASRINNFFTFDTPVFRPDNWSVPGKVS